MMYVPEVETRQILSSSLLSLQGSSHGSSDEEEGEEEEVRGIGRFLPGCMPQTPSPHTV